MRVGFYMPEMLRSKESGLDGEGSKDLTGGSPSLNEAGQYFDWYLVLIKDLKREIFTLKGAQWEGCAGGHLEAGGAPF